MDRKWLPLNALRAFEAAGQHLSFTAAANSLTVAQSAVSRHVIVLENFLGVALFERRPQQLVLTEAGRHILPVVSKSFDRIDQALGEVIKEKGRPKRVLKVALPTSFAHRLAIPILRDFRSENAGISLEIVSKPTTGPEVDGDIDIAIVYSEPRVTDAIHDLLWMVRSTLLCSPKLLEGIDASDAARLIAASDLLHLKIDGRPRHFFWEMLVRSIGRLAAYLDNARAIGCLPHAILVDAHVPGRPGGTGPSIPSDLLDHLPAHPRLILAGGLTPENVAERVARVHPWMVDIASGVESSPGVKDLGRVSAFISAARGVPLPILGSA